MRRKFLVFTILTQIGIGFCIAQQIPLTPSAPQDTPDKKNEQLEWIRLKATALTDYILGPGDTIHIEVLNVAEFNKDSQINQDGTISLPFLDSVRVEGLTAYELQKKLEALLGEGLLKNPSVSVTIKEYRSNPVYVLGEVNRPGTYQLTHFMRLVDMLTMAGGFTAGAGETCSITRTGANGQSTRLEIDLRQLLEQGEMALNIPIESGDMIMVAKKIERVFYILGDVGKPGAYPFPPRKGINLSEALSTAGGFNKTANLNKSYLVRMQPDGSRMMVEVDLKKILSGQQPDQPLKEYDLVYVPNSKSKTVGYSFLNSITMFVNAGLWAAIP